MNFVKRYLIPRVIQYMLVIILGVSAVFIIPRITPNDPVQRTLQAMQSRGSYIEADALKEMTNSLEEMYGLKGSWGEQYLSFWSRLFRGDFGISFFQFPAKVKDLISTALPWTLGLLLTTTLFSWIGGNIIGALAGYYSRRGWSKVLDTVAMILRPLPYYIFAFALLLLLAYVFRIFPVSGGTEIGRSMDFSWDLVKDILMHSVLPALSLTLLGGAANFQTMKLLVQNVNAENFVQYAKIGGVTEDRIVKKYITRNAILPQITGLALSLGQIFSGALITEIVFTYPGLGSLLYRAIVNGDYNLIMGITLFSIVGITTGILLIDLLYPLFDPRVRYT